MYLLMMLGGDVYDGRTRIACIWLFIILLTATYVYPQ